MGMGRHYRSCERYRHRTRLIDPFSCAGRAAGVHPRSAHKRSSFTTGAFGGRCRHQTDWMMVGPNPSRLFGRPLSKGGVDLIRFDARRRISALVEILFFGAVAHHSGMGNSRFFLTRFRSWFLCHATYSVRVCTGLAGLDRMRAATLPRDGRLPRGPHQSQGHGAPDGSRTRRSLSELTVQTEPSGAKPECGIGRNRDPAPWCVLGLIGFTRIVRLGRWLRARLHDGRLASRLRG